MSRFFSSRNSRISPYTPGEQPQNRKYIKLNTNESPFPPSKLASERAMEEARKLQNAGAENVIVSMGPDGAILLDKTGEIHRAKAPEGKALGAFGAGDSMTAGFIKGFLDERDYDYALKLGVAAGSAAVFVGKLPEYEEIMKVFDEV